MTGVDDPYEIPTDADLVVSTSEMTGDEAIASVLDYLVVEGWLDRP
jgi:sulfate adenylyltransferase